jgi:hypothetical protein
MVTALLPEYLSAYILLHVMGNCHEDYGKDQCIVEIIEYVDCRFWIFCICASWSEVGFPNL